MRNYIVRVTTAWIALWFAGKVLKSADKLLQTATNTPRVDPCPVCGEVHNPKDHEIPAEVFTEVEA